MFLSLQVTWALLEPSEFAPMVSASCKTGWMEISVSTKGPFAGAVQAMDSRTPACVSFGNGTNTTTLRINMLASQGEKDYCGVLANNVSSYKTNSNIMYSYKLTKYLNKLQPDGC